MRLLNLFISTLLLHSRCFPIFISSLLLHSNHRMGSVVGRISETGPKYKVISTSPNRYEIRHYHSSVIAYTTMTSESNDSSTGEQPSNDSAFSRLAKYIGVMSAPQNVRAEPIPMTTPVGFDTHRDEKRMFFILPDSFTSPDTAPKPSNPDVHITELPARTVAVVSFSGKLDEKVAEGKAKELEGMLKEDGVSEVRPVGLGEWYYAAYNPPWTLPPMRTNEVHIPVMAVSETINE
eukprot:GHVN01003080.1.p1 GENE.GHVN01003080.1~~GHVN01003080.1.p1  ORF type:complete len:235 (-),score=49.86 GHVN01003080.1:352-1056(-)